MAQSPALPNPRKLQNSRNSAVRFQSAPRTNLIKPRASSHSFPPPADPHNSTSAILIPTARSPRHYPPPSAPPPPTPPAPLKKRHEAEHHTRNLFGSRNAFRERLKATSRDDGDARSNEKTSTTDGDEKTIGLCVKLNDTDRDADSEINSQNRHQHYLRNIIKSL